MRRKSYTKLLFHSGRIRTLDPAHPTAQAIVIDGSQITWTGLNKDILGVPVDEYKLINLCGMTVLPSFGDAHVHFAFFAQSLSNVDLDGCASYREALQRVRKYASGMSKGAWIVGKGWSKDRWDDGGTPHKDDLDRIAPDNPAAILSKDEHLLWTNSLGLKMAGIDATTPDPAGGKIDRDDRDEPTGVLLENAVFYVYRISSRPSKRDAFRMIGKAISHCHSLGVTSLGNFDDIDNFGLLQEYHHKKGLKLRIRQYIPVHFLDEMLALKLRTGFGGPHLSVAGTKIFADGALGSQTALMFEPYRGSRNNCGMETTSEKEMKRLIRAASSNGIACAVHAIGDRANHQTLNAFESIGKKYRRLRHRIEHVQIIRPDDLLRLARLNIIASVQPSHCSSDIDLMKKHWGRRAKNAYPFRDFIDSGARLAFGSDAPIEKLNPFIGLQSAVTRRSFDGKLSHQLGQRLSRVEAVAGFTSGVAYALGDENLCGTITPGRSADIVILKQDPFGVKADQLKDIDVLATFFEGKCVYGREFIDNM
jgi:predicted amidohydrolase YtcJ